MEGRSMMWMTAIVLAAIGLLLLVIVASFWWQDDSKQTQELLARIAGAETSSYLLQRRELLDMGGTNSSNGAANVAHADTKVRQRTLGLRRNRRGMTCHGSARLGRGVMS
jgi:uncharacterized protein YggT (Ycf19 family)